MSDEPLRLLHQDEDLIAVDKPAWAVVHRTRGARGARLIVNELRELTGQVIYPVHRLDRQTSGVLVFALSSAVAAKLSEDIREGLWRKRYVGLCRGILTGHAEVDHPVKEDKHKRPAKSIFEPVETFCGRYTLVDGIPLTGRRHQIRYHLKHLGHPLVGDVRYGQGPINRFFRQQFDVHRHFLHAADLTILRPGRLEELSLHAPLPPDLANAITALRAYDGPVA